MKNCARSARDQVTLVHITAIHHHFILDFKCQRGSVCFEGGIPC